MQPKLGPNRPKSGTKCGFPDVIGPPVKLACCTAERALSQIFSDEIAEIFWRDILTDNLKLPSSVAGLNQVKKFSKQENHFQLQQINETLLNSEGSFGDNMKQNQEFWQDETKEAVSENDV